jgi:phosphoribosylanthranilate isomerase
VRTEVKFCGLTRPEDAGCAVSLGASYLGVIFAGGPRNIAPEAAADVLARATSQVRRVGVFGAADASAIARAARIAGLHIAQLHGDPDAAAIDAVRRHFGGAVWAVLRVVGDLPKQAAALFEAADGVVLDARVEGRLGGTGTALDWASLAGPVVRARGSRPARLVLAGGLTPENVGTAIGHLAPDVVDVSSGVESAPGIKDFARMRAFAVAAGVISTDR